MDMVYGETYTQRLHSLIPQEQLAKIAESLAQQNTNAQPINRKTLEAALGAEMLARVLEPIPILEELILYGLEPEAAREDVPVSEEALAITRVIRNVVNVGTSVRYDAAA